MESKYIEIKPVSSFNFQGFDEIVKVSILFPKVQVGSVVTWQLEEKFKLAPIPGLYSQSTYVGINEYFKSYNVSIESKLPLYINVFDTNKQLNVKTSKTNNLNTVTINARRPVFFKILEEDYSAGLGSIVPYFEVSTFSSWDDLTNYFSPVIDKVKNGSLPAPLLSIAKEASLKNKSLEDQLEFVMAEVQKMIRYIGDWRMVKGKYHPRELIEVVSSGFGDCKDFAMVTVAILNQLKIQSDWTLVSRNYTPQLNDRKIIPSYSAFNHVIVRVQPSGANATPIWIDPTNNVATARILLEDISDRRALPIKPKARLEKIPANVPANNKTTSQRYLDMKKGRDVKVSMNIETLGYTAFNLFSMAKRTPKEQVLSEIFNWFVKRTTDVESWKVKPSQSFGDIVTGFNFKINYFDRNALIRTSEGYAKSHKVSSFIKFLTTSMKARASDIWLGIPSEAVSSTVSNKTVKGQLPKDCTVNSKWIQFDLKTSQDKGMSTTLTQTIKKPRISIQDIKTNEFVKFQKELNECVTDYVFVFNHN